MIDAVVANVSAVPLGDSLTADVASGVSSITVDDAADFDELGGTLRVGGDDPAAQVVAYTAADIDTGVITLGASLAAAWTAGTRVDLWDVANGLPDVEVRALAVQAGDIDNDDVIDAVVSASLVPLLPEGMREVGQGEPVRLELHGSRWVVTDIVGKPTQVQGGFLAPGTVARESLSFLVGTTTVTIGPTAPVDPANDDLWYDSDNDYQLAKWDGSAWAAVQFGTNAIAAGAITADLIAANAIVAGKIAVGALDAMTINAGALTAGSVSAGSIGSSQIVSSIVGGSDFIVDTDGGRILIYAVTGTTVVTLTTTGSSTWACPAGVHSAKVECWGPGGGGSGSRAVGSFGGYGGAGGEYSREDAVALTPSTSYPYTVGAGGAGAAASQPNGGTGADTQFTGDDKTVVAHAGHGALGSYKVGGASGSTNGVHFSGGANGAGGTAYTAGTGGGSSGGTSNNGNSGGPATSNSSPGPGGAAPAGGAAGAGGGVNAAGAAGSAPGGGGGGGGGGVAATAGGAGGRGQIRITYGGTVTLVASIAGASGTDAYGNTYPAGPSGFVPAGSITMFGGASAPTGWLLCDGSSVLRATYPDLFAVIGTTYGSVDGTHFTLPNFDGKFPRGNTRGTGGGSDTHTNPLSDAGQAKVTATSSGEHHSVVSTAAWNANLKGATTAASAESVNPATAVGLMGATDSASNVPAYTGVAFVIKT